MAYRVIEKINSRLKFLYEKKRFLDVPLRRLLLQFLNSTSIWLCLYCVVPKFVKETKR